MTQVDNWCGISRFFPTCADLNASLDKDDPSGHYVTGHPYITTLQEKLSEIYGMPTLLTNRGLSAIATALMVYNSSPAITVACSKYIYPGTKVLLQELAKANDFKLRWIDPTNQKHLYQQPSAQVFFTETIGNSPFMPVTDTKTCLKAATDQIGMLIVDTTATPLLAFSESPRLIVVRSLTKSGQDNEAYTGGSISSNAAVLRCIASNRRYANMCMSHQAAAHFTSGLSGIQERYQAHCDNAFSAAVICQENPGVVKDVWYPKLITHPQHTLLFQQYHNQGGGFLYLHMKSAEAANALCDVLSTDHDNDWHIGPSFGSSDWRTFPFTSKKAQLFLSDVVYGPTDNIVRLAPGRQSPDKNLAALRQALEHLLITT